MHDVLSVKIRLLSMESRDSCNRQERHSITRRDRRPSNLNHRFCVCLCKFGPVNYCRCNRFVFFFRSVSANRKGRHALSSLQPLPDWHSLITRPKLAQGQKKTLFQCNNGIEQLAPDAKSTPILWNGQCWCGSPMFYPGRVYSAQKLPFGLCTVTNIDGCSVI